MKVTLITKTDEALNAIYLACKQCHIADIQSISFTQDEQEKLINKVIKSGHTSVLEHASLTFAVNGVSRALSHQLVRHRIASYTQLSQRYTKNNFYYIIPLSIAKNERASQIYSDFMTKVNETYAELLNLCPQEDARFVLPNATTTSLVVTMNCRSLINFFEERCCSKAQWEIKKLARKMLKIAREELPVIFENVGAKCKRLCYCPEEKSCGFISSK